MAIAVPLLLIRLLTTAHLIPERLVSTVLASRVLRLVAVSIFNALRKSAPVSLNMFLLASLALGPHLPSFVIPLCTVLKQSGVILSGEVPLDLRLVAEYLAMAVVSVKVTNMALSPVSPPTSVLLAFRNTRD